MRSVKAKLFLMSLYKTNNSANKIDRIKSIAYSCAVHVRIYIYQNWLLLYYVHSQCQPIGGIQNI